MVAVKLMAYYNITVSFTRLENCGRRCEIVASEMDSGSSGPGSSPGWGSSISLLGKANYFDCASSMCRKGLDCTHPERRRNNYEG